MGVIMAIVEKVIMAKGFFRAIQSWQGSVSTAAPRATSRFAAAA
jgi:hypothetical protein